ncbi:pyridoxamine 5'-phosphate oxidase family protein [Rhizobium sp. YS-1r]|uniref:pyridoxamine 5'-phosphate oxidase family protein n=1 Tax=Rhizobium sp. YS-1r TaxID=1532558 RepID=UPI0005106026|nr:pyridoxamine 5'-phosphate oxidase family protein [Rhizobium sp. YS-1r]KGE01186.1 pyridoxamine 5-phosphate oxidase [Rhizobium sp. YS-1r]
MAYTFLDLVSTPSVKAAQEANGSRDYFEVAGKDRSFDRFTPSEAAFIAGRDSFYMATVSENGWPYVQHRGGPAGFLQVLDPTTFACADFRGNRQYISVGNLGASDRVSLILMDYPNRSRLKIFAHAEISTDPAILAKVAVPDYRAKVERALVFHLEAFDWNCPQHITPRFTMADIEEGVAALRQRIAVLETENAALRANALSASAPSQGE